MDFWQNFDDSKVIFFSDRAGCEEESPMQLGLYYVTCCYFYYASCSFHLYGSIENLCDHFYLNTLFDTEANEQEVVCHTIKARTLNIT